MAKKSKVNYEELTKGNYTLRVYEQDRKADYWTATLSIVEEFAVKCFIRESSKQGYFISFPNYKNGDGEYVDLAFPFTKDARATINDLVYDVMEKLD